jgi:hypothetical protein
LEGKLHVPQCQALVFFLEPKLVQVDVWFFACILVKKNNGGTYQERGSKVRATFAEDGLRAEVFVRTRFAAERRAELVICHVPIQ